VVIWVDPQINENYKGLLRTFEDFGGTLGDGNKDFVVRGEVGGD
jgi:hypothetical protein